MKDRLKKKLKAKKILGNNNSGGSSPRASKPVKKKEYPMPDYYNEYLSKLTEMIDEQERYKKILPTLPPEMRREALPLLSELDKSIENLEQNLADEYEDYQRRQRRVEDTQKDKDEAFALLYESLQRHFIVMKHKLPPEVFKPFEKKWTDTMEASEREEFYDLVAHRESYDLENILADPDGKVKRPMKHPQIQAMEARFEIDRVLYATDKDFKKLEVEYENIIANRDRAEKKLWLFNPENRPARRKQIEELDRQIDELKPRLIQFLETCFAEDGKIEVEKPDQKKLDAAFALLEVAGDRLYLMIKHTKPHLIEEFERYTFEPLLPEEREEAHQRIAKREAEELNEILKSCGEEK